MAKKKQTAEQVEAQLKKAVKGLTHPSEIDSPFTVVRPTERAIPKGNAVLTEVLPDDLVATDRRFRALRTLLTDSLTDVRVVRQGQVTVTITIWGKAPDGQWLGLRTTSVET